MEPAYFDSPSPPKKLPFALSWLITVPVAVLLLIELRVQLPLARASMKTDQAIAFVMGRLIGGLLFSLLIAWVAWLVGRRSRFAANWGFGIVITVFAMVAVMGDRGRTVNVTSAQIQ